MMDDIEIALLKKETIKEFLNELKKYTYNAPTLAGLNGSVTFNTMIPFSIIEQLARQRYDAVVDEVIQGEIVIEQENGNNEGCE